MMASARTNPAARSSTVVEACLEDLASLADAGASSAGIAAKDLVNSIESAAKNALDDELSGYASSLLSPSHGLPALLARSSEAGRAEARHSKTQVELRTELVKLLRYLLDEHAARDLSAQLADSVAGVVRACIATFRREQDSRARVATLELIHSCVELRGRVPELPGLRDVVFPPDEARAHTPHLTSNLVRRRGPHTPPSLPPSRLCSPSRSQEHALVRLLRTHALIRSLAHQLTMDRTPPS